MTADELLQKRIKELANKAYYQNRYTYTNFLGMSEQNLFYQIIPELESIPYTVYGGNEYSERCVIAFGSEELFGYPPEYPIQCLMIEPLLAKFADSFTHRDFLGSLMNLGIKREMLGDILLKDNKAYVYCMDSIAEYVIENLSRVKHTTVRTSTAHALPENLGREFAQWETIVASTRLDVVIAAVYQLSRSQVIELFRSKKIFVNGRLNENNSQNGKEGDVISVRGFGKFIYDGVVYVTKKERLRISIRKFI